VQLFGTVHQDFHRPSDTIEKLDAAGMAKIVSVLKQTMDYLSGRRKTLTVTLLSKTTGTNYKNKVKQSRKVSMGTLPYFDFTGPGVKLIGVMPGSAAAKSGLLEGGVIISINEQPVSDLSIFAQLLRKMMVGEVGPDYSHEAR